MITSLLPNLIHIYKSASLTNISIYSFFKTLTNQTITVELKNDIKIRGILKSVDQYLNLKLDEIEVVNLSQYPHLSSVKNMFVRGSVVRYISLPSEAVDKELLLEATRKGWFFFSFFCLLICIFPLWKSFVKSGCFVLIKS